jgi:uncharacterized protein (TIGR02147 family)
MNIYQYEDYRHYLKDRLEQERSAASFSWRKFAAKSGFTNPGYINDVIKGRRKLSNKAVEKLVRYFSFLPHEADFFRRMVAFAHSRNGGTKDRIYKELVSRRSRSSFAQLNPEISKYYQDYRYPLVRCALMALDYRGGDPSQIAKFCWPSVPVAVVRRIIKELCAWGVVKIEEGGRYAVTDKFIAPSPKLNAQIRQINREWIRQAEAALMTIGPDDRHIASMLFSVSSAMRDKIKEKIETFRSEIWNLVKNDAAKADCIMLLNTQFVPKSKKRNYV